VLARCGGGCVVASVVASTKSHVTQIPDGRIFLADLMMSACSCIRYQDNVAMRSQPSITLRQELYMPKTLSRGNWVETYKADMAPFDFECSNRLTKLDSNSLRRVEDSGESELEPQPRKPPLAKIPRGMSAKKRAEGRHAEGRVINSRHAVASARVQVTMRLIIGSRIGRDKICFCCGEELPYFNLSMKSCVGSIVDRGVLAGYFGTGGVHRG